VCGSTDIQAQTEQEQQQLEQENKRYQLAVTSKVDELKKLLATAKEQRDTARLALKHFKNRAKIRRQFMLR
jgi:ornithine cyclodeaminase/alanine dehydrogenase-like protein (mu-crystallin family)